MEDVRVKWESVRTYLFKEEHPVGKTFNFLEGAGLPKAVVLNSMVAILAIFLLISEPGMAEFLSAVIVVPQPLFRSFTTLIESNDIDEIKKWLLYWFIFASFEFLNPWMMYLPPYALLKTVYLLCLSLPPVDYITTIQVQLQKPLACIYQLRIDRETMKKAHPMILKQMNLTLQEVDNMDENLFKAKMVEFNTILLFQNILINSVNNQPEAQGQQQQATPIAGK